MSANAPYYQMRPGRFVTTPSHTNATPSRFGPADDEYDASPTGVASPPEHHTASYTERAVRQTSADTPVHTFEENHNMAELLEAATTAAGQAAEAMDAQPEGPVNVATQGDVTRKRTSSSVADDAAENFQADAVATPKRRRMDVPTDPQLQSTGHESRGSSKSTSVGPSGESLLNDARAAGVHSAAALFRRTSERTTTRKYTRPPMSKLFMSLQLSPENFLQLQAQAKTYMLDTTYPERQNCVGNRGKGDTDMVKLRLFNCVRDFLSDGVGEKFFGENVEKPGERDAIEAARALGEDTALEPEERLTWPRDGNKIISLVTPLMRRMVTNERQRMYAIETRKGGSKKKDKEGSVEAAAQQVQLSPSRDNSHGPSGEQHLPPDLDPSLGKHQSSQPISPAASTLDTTSTIPTANMTRIIYSDGSRNDTLYPNGINNGVGRPDNEPIEEVDLPLPSADSMVPYLHNINIFLILAPGGDYESASMTGIKVDEKRITSESTDGLIRYKWADFKGEVDRLLGRAAARFREVRQHCVARRSGSASAPPPQPDNLTDNLRELAAAANAMQGDSTLTDSRAQKLSDASYSSLPRHVIKTVGSGGFETIDDALDWGDLLLRRSREVWADGKLNMIVELVGLRLGEEGKEVAESEGVPAEG